MNWEARQPAGQGEKMSSDFRRFEIEAVGPGEYRIRLFDRTANRKIEIPMTPLESSLWLTLYGRILERIDFQRMDFENSQRH
jgi:hypothetical protein